jgi:hypothetical protein
MTGGDAVKSLVTKMPSCPFCSNEFKNVRLHIVKKHEAIRVKMSNTEDGSPDLYYCGIELVYNSYYDAVAEVIYLYEFPDTIASVQKYDGVALTISDNDNSIVGCHYYKWLPDDHKDGMMKFVGSIAKHRITSSVA